MSSITNLISVGVNGTGTANSVMKWLDADTATDSIIYDNGTSIGIGTTSPSSVAKLHLEGGSDTRLRFSNSDVIGGQIQCTTSSFNVAAIGASQVLSLQTNSAERMRIDSSGNVGIGTSSPLRVLDVRGASSSFGNFFLVDTTSGTTGTGGGIIFGSDNGSGTDFSYAAIQGIKENSTAGDVEGALRFVTKDSSSSLNERMRIDSAGNVGIGVVPSAWTSVGSTKALQISTMSAVFEAYSGTFLSNNIYFDGSTKHITTAPAARLGLLSDGALQFMNAPSGTAGSAASLVERLRIDSSGNVGIGTSSPDSKLQVGSNGYFRVYPANSSVPAVINMGYDNDFSQIKTTNYGGNLVIMADVSNTKGSSYLGLGTDNTEHMRITSGGTVTIGTGVSFNPESNNRNTLFCSSNTTGGTTLVAFFNPNGNIGAITTSGNSTAYLTSSDYRLKENVVEMTGALDRVDALKPSRFNFIADPEKTVDGFLAHEVGEVIPEAIFGEKDAVDEEGNPVYQGIDQSKLVPLLVGAIKELRAEIETLKSQINA